MADPTDLATGLARALARIGLPAPTGMTRLSGGANMESWRFQAGAEVGILRRAPSLDLMAGRPLDHAAEAALIRAARAAGVLAPEVLVELAPADGIGSGFVMRAMAGTADPAAIQAGGDTAPLAAEVARELARIHNTPITGLNVPLMVTADAVAELRKRFIAHGGDRPILALGLNWLARNLPADVPPRLVHGDYRLGNLLVDAGRLTGVLDWELGHLGDPHEDLAFGCLSVWRFGRHDLGGFGLAPFDDFIAAYRDAGGVAFQPDRFRFWTVYRTIWWALGCLQMGAMWRGGHDRSLERVVVARRASEQELDLLLLLESEAPAAERARALPPPPAPPTPGAGEPDGAEMLTAISEWLANDIKPLVAGRQKFDLAVARNALGMVAREWHARPCAEDAALSAQLLAGEADLATPGLLAGLRAQALAKLAADVPKYPSLGKARTEWPV